MIYIFQNRTNDIAKEAMGEAAKRAARIGVDALARHVGLEESVPKERPIDWPYMEQSGVVLDDLPETWKAYKQDEEGRMDIIKMEYGELLKAKGKDAVSHELVHLGSACLHLWRLLNDAE